MAPRTKQTPNNTNAIDIDGSDAQRANAYLSLIDAMLADLYSTGASTYANLRMFLLHVGWHEGARLKKRAQIGGGPGRSFVQFEAALTFDAVQYADSAEVAKKWLTKAAVAGGTTASALKAATAKLVSGTIYKWPVPAGEMENLLLANDLFALYLARYALARVPDAIPTPNADQATYWADHWKKKFSTGEERKKLIKIFQSACDEVDKLVTTKEGPAILASARRSRSPGQRDAPTRSLATLSKEIAKSRGVLKELDKARSTARNIITPASPAFGVRASKAPPTVGFRLIAQGDSWFDYAPGHDIIDFLEGTHGHKIENLAVGGSTINDIVYGPVPKNLFGIPQSDEVKRIVELVNRIDSIKPQALLLSGGGNDIAGPEFFQFVNNAESGLPNPNANVLKGVLSETFVKAYEDLIDASLAAAYKSNNPMKIFTHGYDYPWPDGRSVFIFGIVGPWFDGTFNKKNYPFKKNDAKQLKARYDIIKVFIDALNEMLIGLQMKYPGRVFHVDLRNMLKLRNEWANELHPKDPGFGLIAAKFNEVMHQHLP